MTNVEALKALYVALGGETSGVANAITIVDVLNATATLLGSTEAPATTNADAITNIVAVAGNANPPKLQNKTVTVNAVTSAIDDNIVAGNIKSGVTILGVEGTYTGE